MYILTKREIWESMPAFCKLPLSLLYHTLKSPMDYRRNRNMSNYDVSVGKEERISYVPPLFDVFISSKCNLRCPSCCFRLRDIDVFDDGEMIKMDVLQSLIDNYADVITTVWLSGGEPLLHPELSGIVNMLKIRGLSVMLSTNGLLIEEHVDTLATVDFINVSIDGYDYGSFKQFRGGSPHQFDNLVKGLSLLREHRLPFTISFLLSESNIGDVHKMLGFAKDVSSPRVYFHNVNPHGNEGYKPLTMTEGAIEVMAHIMSRVDYPFDIVLPAIYDTASYEFRAAKCIQPWVGCYFDSEGDIAYCCHLRHSNAIGNIFDGYDFNSPPMMEFRHRMITNTYAEDCLYCPRRFVGQEYGYFNMASKKWLGRGTKVNVYNRN